MRSRPAEPADGAGDGDPDGFVAVAIAVDAGRTPVAAARIHRGLSREELAARIGVEPETIAHIEASGVTPAPLMRPLAEALDVPLDLLAE